MSKNCPRDKILNPNSGRCVSKTGKIGKELLGRIEPKNVEPKNVKPKKGECSNDKVLNPNTGRCVSKPGKIGKEILGIVEPKKVTPSKNKHLGKDASTLDIDSDGYISIKEYLSRYRSKGEKEISKGVYKAFNSFDFGNEFLLHLLNDNKNIVSKVACIPMFYYCPYMAYKNNKFKYYIKPSINKYCEEIDNGGLLSMPAKHTRGVIIYFDAPRYNEQIHDTQFIAVPDNFVNSLYTCKKDNKEIVYVNLNLRAKVVVGSGPSHSSHANSLIFNTVNNTIERFDPHGASSGAIYNQILIDQQLKAKFEEILPEYRYIPLNDFCPYLGPQAKADTFGGLCLTWAVMYALIRILNPNINQKDVISKMMEGSRENILDKILRFQKYMISVLQKSKKSLL